MAQSTNTSVSTGARRRSQRVLMQVAVRIRGTDAQGKTIEEETETLAINAHGALVLLESRLTSGSAAAAVQAVNEDIPGTTVTRWRAAISVRIPLKLP